MYHDANLNRNYGMRTEGLNINRSAPKKRSKEANSFFLFYSMQHAEHVVVSILPMHTESSMIVQIDERVRSIQGRLFVRREPFGVQQGANYVVYNGPKKRRNPKWRRPCRQAPYWILAFKNETYISRFQGFDLCQSKKIHIQGSAHKETHIDFKNSQYLKQETKIGVISNWRRVFSNNFILPDTPPPPIRWWGKNRIFNPYFILPQ
jgi:hypothetical protein